MKKYLIYLLLLYPILAICSNVNGNAFLDNDSNHSGITIKFLPVSGSAEYAEGITDSNGIFNVSVISGVYIISYEKIGYQSYTIDNQFISDDITLSDVTLNSSTIVYVSGNVSGNWISSNTYIVTGDITVPEGEVLNIEPNTEIKFDGFYSLLVNGTINAAGQQDNYIRFTSNNNNPTIENWNHIVIDSNEDNILDYCIIEYGQEFNADNNGIITVYGKITVSNSIIRDSDDIGISVKGSGNVLLIGNKISNCSLGILVSSNSSGSIDIIENEIYNNEFKGMYINLTSATTTISQNIIHNNNFHGIQSWADVIIDRNIIFNNIDGIFIVEGQPNIINNTIIFNNDGIVLSDIDTYNPNPIIDSNIFYDNVNYGIRSEGVPMPSVVTHNLFYNNGSGVGNNLPVGVGTIVTENNNGTDSDTFYNIFDEPSFVSINPIESDFCELLESSEAINAGNPNIDNPFNSSIIDIGAREFEGNLSVNEFSNNNKIIVYPNPINDFVSIKSSNKEFNKVSIYDINGKLIKNINQPSLGFEMTLQISDFLKTGFYFFKIFEDDTLISTIKILKN